MKRSGFKRPEIQRSPRVLYRLARPCPSPSAGHAEPVPKEAPVRSEPYRRLVAALPCINCSAQGRSQAAHPNTGKGAGMKADDRLCFPMCADAPGVRGCHSRLDQGALFSKTERRLFEVAAGRATRSTIMMLGFWPPDLPRWTE